MDMFDADKFAEELPEETIEKVHEYANKLLSVNEIAVLLGISTQMMTLMVRDDSNKVGKAYALGKAERVLKMHEQEIDLAETGSAQAMANMHGFLNQMNSAED